MHAYALEILKPILLKKSKVLDVGNLKFLIIYKKEFINNNIPLIVYNFIRFYLFLS